MGAFVPSLSDRQVESFSVLGTGKVAFRSILMEFDNTDHLCRVTDSVVRKSKWVSRRLFQSYEG